MKRGLERQGGVAGVGDVERHRQPVADGDSIVGGEPVRPRRPARHVVVGEPERQLDFAAAILGAAQGPLTQTREAVHRRGGVGGVGGKPGEADWDAATNRLVGMELAVAADPDYRVCAGGPPRRHVGAVQVDLGRGQPGGNRQPLEAIAAGAKA